MDQTRQFGARPLRLTAQQPSLKLPPAKMQQPGQRAPRPALVDVSNQHHHHTLSQSQSHVRLSARLQQQSMASLPQFCPPLPKQASTGSISSTQTSAAAAAAAPAQPSAHARLASSTAHAPPAPAGGVHPGPTMSRPASVAAAPAAAAPPVVLPPPIAMPVRSASQSKPNTSMHDVSMMSNDTSATAAPASTSFTATGVAPALADTTRTSDGLFSPSRFSSSSARSDDSEMLAELEMDLDPAGIVTLTLERELVEQRRVLDICDRFEMSVLVPQALAAQAERHELVRHGELSAAAAAHDDEMMRLGLDTEEARDISMVAEYAQDIFDYMACTERESMANPNYMDFQDEIQWHMRATLIDWLLQVHMRYHMLPETLWIAVNIVDRFLSARIVSLAKLQLVGVTAMFIAAKYEEILAPSVEEFVYMTDGGYSRDEILKGERIVLSTLDFNVSTYCSPYSWVRRISKADDYDIQTRTLCKCLMEVTLLNHLFLRVRPSMIAAIGMFLAKRMLGGVWDDAFVYYSRFTEAQLLPGANLLLEKLAEPGFEEQFVYKKYASKKFLKASIYAHNWALRHRAPLTPTAPTAPIAPPVCTEPVSSPHTASSPDTR